MNRRGYASQNVVTGRLLQACLLIYELNLNCGRISPTHKITSNQKPIVEYCQCWPNVNDMLSFNSFRCFIIR